jgi:FlaA1/EpsC-like NDP-sugar epimerase
MTCLPFPLPTEDIERVLGRPVRPADLANPLARLAGERVLVTGANGSVGTSLVPILQDAGIAVLPTDVDELDVRRARAVSAKLGSFRPTLVFHLAGAKHAPEGETDPLEVMEVNGIGTANVVAAAGMLGARVVTASTCKSCDPETAYGASKLLAERLTLAAGHNVARFYNVVETSGNVFEIWRDTPAEQPLAVTPCRRFFVSLDECIALTIWASVLPQGRYTVDPGEARWMPDIVASLYPGRATVEVPPRRGDRVAEPRHAASEQLEHAVHTIERVWSPHDADGYAVRAGLQRAA